MRIAYPRQNVSRKYTMVGLSLRAVTFQHRLQLRMLDFPLMLWLKLPAVDKIQPQSNKFATVVEN